MKRIFSILTVSALSLFAFSACNGTEPEEVDTKAAVEIVKSSLVIPAKGGSATIEFDASASVTASSSSDWLSVSVDGRIATATADINESLNSRYAQVIITSAGYTEKLTVQQLGFITSGFGAEDISISAHAAEFTYEYSFDDLMVASVDADWVTLDVTENTLKVSVAENTTVATDENRRRTATVEWVLGIDKGTISVTQRNTDFMKADDNWTPSYDGSSTYQGDDVDLIKNTVATSGISGLYAITYFAKSDFVSSEMSMDDYIENVVSIELAEEIQDAIDYYAAFGYTLSFSDFLYEDTETEMFDVIDAGDYYAAAIGYTADGQATGHYAANEFKKESSGGGGGGSTTGYEAWLGEWTSVNGTVTNTWVIAEKEKGSSYTITGIDGQQNAPLTAEYDSSNSSLVVRAQTDLGSYTSSTYGELNLGFYGCLAKEDGSSTFWTPTGSPYAIFVATMDDSSSATLTPQTITSNGEEVTFTHCKYIGTSTEGKYISIRSNANSTQLPGKITRVGGNGGGGEGGSGSEAYKKWLGNWTVGGMSLNISQNVADASYYIKGWQIEYKDGMKPMNASFNSDGSITLISNPNTPFYTNVSLNDSENDPFDFYYYGTVMYQEKEYYITSQNDDLPIAKGVIGSDGNATLSALEVSLNIGTLPFYRIQVYAISSSTSKVYSLQGAPDGFPLSMTRAGSSSVKSMAVSEVRRNAPVSESYEVRMPGVEAHCAGVALQQPTRRFIKK